MAGHDFTAETLTDYLAKQAHKDTLRFITCGSVDDGKSTLIGRLLYESKMIFDDQLTALGSDVRNSAHRMAGWISRFLLTGWRLEREQGITIDVAYRYFTTDRRNFIVADTPAMSNIPAIWQPAPRPRAGDYHDRRAQGPRPDQASRLHRRAAWHPECCPGHQQDGPRRLCV